MIDQQVVSWYPSPLKKKRRNIPGITRWRPQSTTVRNWKEHWTTERVRLEVRADNITALTMVLTLKGSSPAINQITRELALDFGDASFRSGVITHTPGVASCIAEYFQFYGMCLEVPSLLPPRASFSPSEQWAALTVRQRVVDSPMSPRAPFSGSRPQGGWPH